MLKKALLFFFVVLIFIHPAQASLVSQITSIRVSEMADKVRIVLDISGTINYTWQREDYVISLDLSDTVFSPKVKVPSTKNSALIRAILKEHSERLAKLKIGLKFPSYASIFPLYYPNRLVIDLKRGMKEFERKKVMPGLEYVRFATVTETGPVVGSLLRVNPKYFDVVPTLARGIRKEPGFFDNALTLFKPIFPWLEESTPHFFKERTSVMAKRDNAVAAVNGTFFGKAGEPLGILMINRELVSSPIHDRTALIFDEKGEPFIDSVLVNTYFTSSDGVKVNITAFNQARTDSDVILYTPKFGLRTSTKDCSEAVVSGSVVTEVNGGDSKIPKDGFVISSGKALEGIFKKQKDSGGKVDIKVELIPYSSGSAGSVRHIIGGGPRLIKAGRVYVSKREEKFKPDIAGTHAARTAVGITADGQLLFVAIDRTARINDKSAVTPSDGMTLEDLSEFLLRLGAVDAVNFDGGGSTTMVLSGEVVNEPANGSEIAVSNAMLIKPKL